MAGTWIPDKQVHIPGGKRLDMLPVAELSVAMGRMPSEKVLSAATILADQLHEMDFGFLATLGGRHFSRSIKSILEYFNLNNDEMQELIRVLAHFKYASPFFNLATPDNDDGLKRYLIDRGVLWEQILFYYEFSAWTPVRFSANFLIGLGYSVASILEVVKGLFDFGVEAFDNPEEAKKKIKDLVDGLRKLSLESLAAMAKEEWAAWNKEFSEALYDLDFDKAGFMLGKFAGDLWQLLTGIRTLAKLPGMTLKLARKYAPLFARGIRATKDAAILLGELLAKVGSALKEVVEVGFSGLMNFLDDPVTVLKAFYDGAMATVDKYGKLIFFTDEFGAELSLAGGVPSSFLMFDEVKDVSTLVARVRTSGKKTLDQIRGTLESYAKKARGKKKLTVGELAELKKIQERLKEFVDLWRKSLVEALEDEETAKKIRIMISRREFGSWLHDHMQLTFDVIEKEIKSFKSLSEISIKSLAGEMGIAAELQERANIKIIDFLKSRKDLWKVLGVKSEKELPDLIKALGYTDPATAVAGSMKSDAILYDWFRGKVYSFDWTSGLGRYQFVKVFATAEKSEIPKLLSEFLPHAQREYVLRQAVLAYVFEGWSTAAVEILYDPLPFKFFKITQ